MLDEHSRALVREVLNQQQQSSLPARGFSKASSSDADDLLEQLELTEVLGDDLEPIVVPPEHARHHPAFDYSAYRDENEGLGPLQQYHQRQLEQQHIPFGRGGFRIYDIHSQSTAWSIRSSKYQLSGTADLCVASHGLTIKSAAKRAFIVYEHKQTDAQKEAYRLTHPNPMLVRYAMQVLWLLLLLLSIGDKFF